MGEVSSLWWEKYFSDLRKSLHSLSKNKNLLKMYSPFGHLRCRWVCFFIGTDMEKCIITLLPHQWIICSEWVPSEWESKHHNNPQVGLIHYKLTSCKAKRWVFVVNKSIIKGIVHFEIKIWYLSAYPKGIQDVGVFFSSVDPILMFLGQTVLVCQSYNGRYRSLSL